MAAPDGSREPSPLTSVDVFREGSGMSRLLIFAIDADLDQ